jgi:hypothetical protein
MMENIKRAGGLVANAATLAPRRNRPTSAAPGSGGRTAEAASERSVLPIHRDELRNQAWLHVADAPERPGEPDDGEAPG